MQEFKNEILLINTNRVFCCRKFAAVGKLGAAYSSSPNNLEKVYCVMCCNNGPVALSTLGLGLLNPPPLNGR